MEKSKVICFGEALVDRLGPFGGDPAVDEPTYDYLGGAPANVACGLAKLGETVSFIGGLGDDEIGRKFIKLFSSRGVDISATQVHPCLPTRIVLVRRDLSGDRQFGGFIRSIGKGFADQFLDLEKFKNLSNQIFENATWLVLGTIPLASESSKESLSLALENAQNSGINVLIDINWRPTFWEQSFAPDSAPNPTIKSEVVHFLEHGSLLKLAKEEAFWFFNTKNPLEISNSLPQKPSVIVTDGPNPICWKLGCFSGETKVDTSLRIVDTTGAGDAFTAGLISQLTAYPLPLTSLNEAEKMIKFAAGCGALVCSNAGAIEPQPTYSDVEKFLSSSLGELT